ncbi:MAG: sigma 54-interacting transcriptional regulator [Acidobacteriota bacterium]
MRASDTRPPPSSGATSTSCSPGTASARSASRRAGAPRRAFVGREAALEKALNAVLDARRGSGSVTLLEGREGSGKTRLLAEIRIRAELMGAMVAGGGVADRAPYAPWRALARTLADRARARGVAVPEAGLFSKQAAERAPARGETDGELAGLDVEGRQVRLFDETCRCLELATSGDLGREEPVVFLLDDLDEVSERDAGTRDLLTFFARQVPRIPIAVIGSTTVAGPERVPLPPQARTVSIEPLTLTQTGHLTASLLGVEDVPRALSSIIHEESGGNPADVEDFVRALLDEGALGRGEDGGLRVTESNLAKVPTPARVKQWVERQASQLDAECRITLSVAGLLPEPFAPALLSRALGFSEELTFDVLDRLEKQGAVRCRGGAYLVAGAKLRRHLTETLAASSRRDLMDRIGRALVAAREGGAAIPDAEIADYLEEGKTPAEAIPYLLSAASEAYAMLALRDSIALLKRAAALVISDDEGIDSELLAVVRERLADRLAESGDVLDAAGIYESLLLDEAGGNVEGPAEDAPAVRIRLKVSRLYQRRGEFEKAHDSLKDVLQLLDRDRDASLISEVLSRIGWIFKSKGIYQEALKYCERALKVALEANDGTKVANALNHLGVIHYNKGDLAQSQVYYVRALHALLGTVPSESDAIEPPPVPSDLADPERARVILNNLGNVYWKRGDWNRAREHYETALVLSERIGHLSGIASAANNMALISFGRGDWDAAIGGFERSLAIKSKLGESAGVAVGLNNLAETYERVGRWREARESYERALELNRGLGETKRAGVVLLALGNLHRKLGDLDTAERLIHDGSGTLEGMADAEGLAYAQYFRALLLKDREDFVSSLRLLSDALATLERRGAFHEMAKIYTSTADLHMRMGDLDKARELSEHSLRLARELGDRFEEGKVLSVIGRLRYQRRERAQAREAFEEGIKILEELGASFELGRSLYELGLRTEDSTRAARYLERAIGLFRSIGAGADLERAIGTYDRIRENLQGFDAPEARAPGEVVGLYETAKIINSSLDLDEVLERVMDLVLERTRADSGLLLLLETDGSLKVRAARNIARENLRGISEISASIVHEVIKSQGPLLAGNASLDPRFSAQKSIVLHGILSIAAVPLRIRDRIAGAIYLDHRKTPDYFTDKDLRFLQAFADQAAIAIENARLYRELREALDRVSAENRVLRAETVEAGGGSDLVGTSRAFRQVLALVEKAALTGETTLLLGESGTGKSFLARAIHDRSPRREGPFVKFNCAALPETLVESELFGHERGAFTGADRRKLGRFEIASAGTIFLDEIGNISGAVQAKLLRILEDKEFERLGGNQTIRTDAQIVTATNRDLGKAIRDGSFREDLFYRLNIFPIQIPALRERREDIPLLAARFLGRVSSELQIKKKGFSPQAIDLLTGYDWPGNVRELESTIRRAVVLAEGDVIESEDLRWLRSSDAASGRREVLLEEAIRPFMRAPRRGEKVFQAVTENVERVLIRNVLTECNGQIREAARRLGVARNTLKSKMKLYELAGRDEGER